VNVNHGADNQKKGEDDKSVAEHLQPNKSTTQLDSSATSGRRHHGWVKTTCSSSLAVSGNPVPNAGVQQVLAQLR
jgi:hypothetical protein